MAYFPGNLAMKSNGFHGVGSLLLVNKGALCKYKIYTVISLQAELRHVAVAVAVLTEQHNGYK